MIPKLSSEQRRALAEIGTPIPIYYPDAQAGFILIPAEITSDPLGGHLAAIPGLPGVGAGDTPEDAVLALSVGLRTLLTSPEGTAFSPFDDSDAPFRPRH